MSARVQECHRLSFSVVPTAPDLIDGEADREADGELERPGLSPGRQALVAFSVIALGVAVIAPSVSGLFDPLLHRRSLPAAKQVTGTGIPVPRLAKRCLAQTASGPGAIRWCLPGDVSARTLESWYAVALPAGRDAPGLRWCHQLVAADGARRFIWSAGDALVGYELPPPPLHARTPEPGEEDLLVMSVFRVPDRSCPAAAAASRRADPAPAAAPGAVE